MMNILSLIFLGCDSEPAEAPAVEPAAQVAAEPAAQVAAEPAAQATPAAPTPSANSNQLSGYTGTFASDPKLSPADVVGWAPSDFRVKRNEIYARYGRAFKSEDLQAHFGKTDWYSVHEGYADAMLTKNDTANVSLIKSFEGDTAQKKATENGEYFNGNGTNLVIVDGTHAELVDQTEDMYNWSREERYWTGIGAWIITWEGPATWNPSDSSVRNARLWSVDHESQGVNKTIELQLQQG